MCKIDSEDSSLRIKINEESRDYLVGMKRWSEIQPRIYLKLTTAYQNWFYAYFKKELYLIENSNSKVKITVEISTLKEMLYLDEVKTYKESKNANEKFFNNFFIKLAGTNTLRKQIESGLTEEEIRDSWKEDLDNYKEIRSKYLLYKD